MIAPGFLETLNEYRTAAGVQPVKAMPLELLSSQAPVKPANVTALVRQGSQITPRVFTAPAQGGFSQYWSEHIARDESSEIINWNKPHSCDAPSKAPASAQCDEYGDPSSLNPSNSAERSYNTYLPPDQRGYTWSCGENVGLSAQGKSARLVEIFRRSTNHWRSLMNPWATYVSFGAVTSEAGEIFTTVNMCQIHNWDDDIMDSRPDYLPVKQ